MELRPYQEKAVSDLRASLLGGKRSPLLVMPTGSGKTLVANAIIDIAVKKGKQVLFLAPRREIIHQTIETVRAAGVHAGVIMAGEPNDMFAPVQVACVPTLHRRLAHTLPPPADILLLDECHLSISKSNQEVLAHYPNAIKIGLTATPARTDGRGLGEVFDDLVMGPTIRELTDWGFLVDVEYFAPTTPDLDGVKIQMGDYNQRELGEKMIPLIGDVITNWARIAPDRQTVVFTVNVAHSRYLCEAFREIGVVTEHIDAKTPNDERRDILYRVHKGDVQVITNCDVLSMGWDCPPISCAVLARPTKSIARYLQAAGRVLRPYPGKENCIMIDHTGVVEDLGFVDDIFPWTLDGKERVQERIAGDRPKAAPLTCPKCATIFKETDTCPACGHRMVSERKEAIEAVEADLAQIDKKSRTATAQNREWDTADKQEFYSGLIAVGIEKGYKSGWSSTQYKQKFGVWPNAMKKVSGTPTSETRAWIKSRQIAWAMRNKKKAAA